MVVPTATVNEEAFQLPVCGPFAHNVGLYHADEALTTWYNKTPVMSINMSPGITLKYR